MSTEREQEQTTAAIETESTRGGTTEIEADVVAAIAGYALRQVEGVVRVGGGGLMRTVTDRVESESASYARGIKVELGRQEVTLDMDLVVAYGYPIPTILEKVRRAVSSQILEQTGLRVKAINLKITGVEFAEKTEESTSERAE